MVKSRRTAGVVFLASAVLGLAISHPAGFAEDTALLGNPAPQTAPVPQIAPAPQAAPVPQTVPAPQAAAADVLQKKVSVNVKDLGAQSFFGLLSQQAGVPISVSPGVTGNISYVATDRAVQDVLDEITAQNGLEYTIQNGTVLVDSKNGGPGGGDFGTVHRVPLKFASCTETLAKIQPLLPKDGKLLADETTNSLIFMGSPETYEKVVELAALFDTDPKQIMIEGLVVEANETFLQNIGFSYNLGSAVVTNASPTGPNLALTAATIARHNLNLSVNAAEARGDAKVISRPKLVTLNNTPATLNSGLTINVKTLSATQSAQPGQVPVAVAGGLSQISAGLTVMITPTIVGENKVKLVLSVNSSSPDSSATVDGIPGVNTDAATTTVIVENDRTAIIAGLIKQTKSLNHDGVPFLMDIPILGFLFRSDNRQDQNNELAIFITPSILKTASEAAFYPANVPSARTLLDGVGNREPARAVNQILDSPRAQK